MRILKKAIPGLLMMLGLILPAISQAQTKSFNVNVKWPGGDGRYLELTTNRDGAVVRLDSAIVKNGAAVLTMPAPEIYSSVYLSINRAYMKELLVHAGKTDVMITNAADPQLQATTQVNGGLEQDLLEEYNNVFMKGLRTNLARTQALKKSVGKTQAQKDSIIASYKPIFDSLLHAQDYVTTKYADQDIAGYIMIKRVAFLTPEEQEKQYNALSKRLKGGPYGLEIRSIIDNVTNRKLGKPAFQFTASDQNNHPVKLSDYKGKYVLLDFWSSTCAPCLRMAPYVKQLYDTYKQKGFEIIAVSLDTKRNDWIAAMQKHDISGVQVSSLKGAHDPIAKFYGVQQMPSMILIDPQGNNAGPVDPTKLDAKLAEIFDKK
ncbi:TlpA disulfide reductase family protein [Mucilaginibacter paludis]|uniref:Alkyl hydroperoxide reductase/ Thiol specific antioxidant/ Mal allergen n=1 Tax=Mucilaginibacter paludis DSM 18603 TaxID=714943 RepID=H1YFY6_9SPHI|nr:TlpA disulfide reductase family protein [Mucilaginibacter paludis]EHQ26274.1 alkyl hydroperoxide reductase/ Thiol specific antioxidant/ Mal allergen [Mucilaginibacter paludis DSM 18603]